MAFADLARRVTRMAVSRRDFLRASAAAGSGAALGGVVGLGADLAPTLAAA